MRTLDVSSAGWSIARDLRLIARMALMVYGYWRIGARVRREYRLREARGETFWVDVDEIPHREKALRRP